MVGVVVDQHMGTQFAATNVGDVVWMPRLSFVLKVHRVRTGKCGHARAIFKLIDLDTGEHYEDASVAGSYVLWWADDGQLVQRHLSHVRVCDVIVVLRRDVVAARSATTMVGESGMRTNACFAERVHASYEWYPEEFMCGVSNELATLIIASPLLPARESNDTATDVYVRMYDNAPAIAPLPATTRTLVIEGSLNELDVGALLPPHLESLTLVTDGIVDARAFAHVPRVHVMHARVRNAHEMSSSCVLENCMTWLRTSNDDACDAARPVAREQGTTRKTACTRRRLGGQGLARH